MRKSLIMPTASDQEPCMCILCYVLGRFYFEERNAHKSSIAIFYNDIPLNTVSFFKNCTTVGGRFFNRKFERYGSATTTVSFIDFMQNEEKYIPLFLEKCIDFIEAHGLTTEGIYRVPGNRTHVALLYQKFSEECDDDIEKWDIPVNAVTTGIKDFITNRLPPIFEPNLLAELQAAVASAENRSDRSNKMKALKAILEKLPSINLMYLKYIIGHLVRVSLNSNLNSMHSKNLAMCWCPTILPLEFTCLEEVARIGPVLEETLQIMIDEYDVLFNSAL